MATDLPPTEYFTGIVFNPANYTDITDALTLEYALENFLPSQGVAISYANTSFTAPVSIADATITTSLKLPNTITGFDGATCTAFASNTGLGLDTFTVGNTIAGQDLKNINLNCATTLQLGVAGIGLAPTINILTANKTITVGSRGTSGVIAIGASDTSSICPVNINTGGGATNTALTTIGTSVSGVSIVGSSTIGTTTANSCVLNANVSGTCAVMNLPSATITATSFVGTLTGSATSAASATSATNATNSVNTGVTAVSTVYNIVGSSSALTGTYALQAASSGNFSFTPSTQTMLIGGGTNGNISVIGTASSIAVAGTGTAISCPNATGISFPSAEVTAISYVGCLKSPTSTSSGTSNLVIGALTFTPDTSPSALSSIMQFSLNVTSTITLTAFSVTGIRNNTTFSFVVTTGAGVIFTIPTGLANCKINSSVAIPASSYGLFQVSYLANSAGVYFYFIESFGVFV